jgi:hypothetical protein
MKQGVNGSTVNHKIAFGGKVMTAQHIRIGCKHGELQYFLVRFNMTDFILGRESIEDAARWMAGYAANHAQMVGTIIEKETNIALSVNPDPFSEIIKSTAEVLQFNIDSIAVERVKLVTSEVTVSYYLFQVEDDTVFRLACFWFTLVDKKFWYPLMPMDPIDIYHVSDMLMEYESGKHDMWCKANDELVALLQHLENEKHRNL